MRIVTCWVAPFLLCTLFRTSKAFDVFLVSKVSAGSFVDIDACYDALFNSDANGDGRITGDEYVTVVQTLGPPGFVENATTYEEMPRSLRQAFNLLACLCTLSGTDETCCVGDNANIATAGTGPNETPTDSEEVYLFSVCLTTESTISQTLGTTAPTPMPSASPSVATLAPVTDQPTTLSPTTIPPVTLSPTTFAPITISPTTIPPTTVAPTTIRPTTLAPAAPIPSTVGPVAPTSSAPATLTPSTVSPVAIPTAPTPTTPAPASTDFPVEVVYDVALRGGVESSYVVDLNQAMNILAPEVAVQNFPAVRVRRRLTVNTRLPTRVTGSIPNSCPGFLDDSDVCLGIIHSITLVIEDQDAEVAQGVFAEALDAAILEGRLQAILNEVNSESTVYIVSGLAIAPTPVPATGGGINTGAGVGIAIGVIAGIVLIGAALYVARKNQADKDDRENTYFPGAPTQSLASPADVEEDIVVAPVGAGTLGASQADYKIKSKGSKSAKAFETLEEGKGVDKAAASADTGGDSSSNAGSSGWSSSAGVSSLNTGSVDSSEIEGMHGSKLAAIGAASAIAGAVAVGSKRKKKDREKVPPVPDVSREDLDTAIESGDWAAVGATAALLAAASDSQSYSSRSRRTDASAMSRGGSSISSLDAARAAELDHLVDAGDWEGVVVAAARFEASEDTSGSGGKTGSSGHSGTSHSESPGKAAKRDEIREEVESLVRRVVPEEIDNVDEMMMQFKGREEELVETLRTMQERQVAQKARVQGQKQAKRDARQLAQQGGMALPVPPASTSSETDVNAATAAGIGIGVAAAAGIAAAVGVAAKTEISSDSDSEAESIFAESEKGSLAPMLDETSKRSQESSPDEDEFSSKKRRTALELAIEAGDWEAVGEAAAMMSDGSVNSASTGEINRLADNSTVEGSTVGSDLKYEVNAERAAELDSMIDQGDWTGVVAAASRYNSSDKGSSSKSSNVTPTAQDGSTSAANSASVTDEQKEARLKEEQEALAQADMWMAIAQQSKSEGSPDAGASDAADWAIARSLSALKTAEAKGELNRRSSESDASESESGRSV